jgi:hypothetical protein
MEAPKRLNYPYLTSRDTSPSRANLEVFGFSSSDGCLATTAYSASRMHGWMKMLKISMDLASLHPFSKVNP